MNTILLAVSTLSLAFPPASTNAADSEVIVTVPLVQSSKNTADFRLALTASPSNDLEIAIGTDADGDGTLSLLEADVLFGCDCGTWFSADAKTGKTTFESSVTGRTERTWTFALKKFNPAWNAVRLIRRGTDATDEMTTLTRRNIGTIIFVR